MIYLFHGSDGGKVRTKALAWVAAARAKAPDAPYLRYEAKEITETALLEAIGTQGLFFAKSLIVLDDPFSESTSADVVLANLKELAESENPIAIIAPGLLAARAKKVEAKAEKVFHIESVKKAVRGFNSGLVNALGAKDGKALWLELERAKRQEDVPEMLHGLLHWKARDLMQKGGRGWSREEARELSRELIELLSDSRGADLPLKESLEKFALRYI